MVANLKSYLDSIQIWSPHKRAKKPSAAKKVNLALQGGGAHGAFTWGVLDHLLADGRLEITGISGASAGAVNAVMVADGLARGDNEEARKRLAEFWRAASAGGDLPPLQRAVADRLFTLLPMTANPLQAWMAAMSRHLSPYDFNPLNINPLRDLIQRFVDFDAVRASDLALFISATNVHTGRLRVFTADKIDVDVVMASAALPLLFRAVEIDGVPYWDGGYMGNPAIFPFLSTTDSKDVIVVQINPIARENTPRTSDEIVNRLNEITFNSTLISEFRTIDFVNRLIDDGHLPNDPGDSGLHRLNIHRIDLGAFGARLSAASRLSNDYGFFDRLHRAGQRAARRFMDQHFDKIGVTSSVDLAVEGGVEWA